MTDERIAPATLLAAALIAVDDEYPGVLNNVSIDDGAAGPVADAILAALAERGMTIAPTSQAEAGAALERLTPTEGHVAIFIDPGPKYRAVVYDPDGRWNEDEWQQYSTLAQAIAAALGDG
jgi:hypothetical protein